MILGLDGTQIAIAAFTLAGIAVTQIGLVAVSIFQNVSLKRRATETQQAAELAAWGTAVKADQVLEAVHENVGQMNGRGNLMEMVERIDERSEQTHKLLLEHIKRYDVEHPHK